MRTDKRAAAFIVKDNQILVFKRFKNNRWYHAFPGGGVEEGETPEQTICREMKEELSIDIKNPQFLFDLEIQLEDNDLFHLETTPNKKHIYSPYQYFYLVTDFSGTPELGGPEKDRQCETNQYIPEWIPLAKLHKTTDLYPKQATLKLIELISSKKL